MVSNPCGDEAPCVGAPPLNGFAAGGTDKYSGCARAQTATRSVPAVVRAPPVPTIWRAAVRTRLHTRENRFDKETRRFNEARGRKIFSLPACAGLSPFVARDAWNRGSGDHAHHPFRTPARPRAGIIRKTAFLRNTRGS